MQTMTKLLFTAGLGAATMYYLDPAQGRRRRAIALDRIEHGRDGLQQATRTARAVSRDVSHRADRTIHGLRAVGHDVGEQAGRLSHGLRTIGRGTRDRAAGAASSVGALFQRNDRHAYGERARSALKFAGIPVKWLLVAGIGASVMYFLDPSQGLYRRVRFRRRYLDGAREKMGAAFERERAQGKETDEAQQAAGAPSNSGATRREDRESQLPR